MAQEVEMENLGIIGVGKIGRAVGTLALLAGYRVLWGVRDPGKVVRPEELAGGEVATVDEVVRRASMVVLAVPHGELGGVAATLSPFVEGTVVIDATNPFRVTEGVIASSLEGITEGEYLQGLLPGAPVYRAFSHVMDELLVSRGTRQPGFWAMAVAGAEGPNLVRVEALVRSCGFAPVHVGGLARSAVLDPGGAAFPHIFTEAELRRVVSTPPTSLAPPRPQG